MVRKMSYFFLTGTNIVNAPYFRCKNGFKILGIDSANPIWKSSTKAAPTCFTPICHLFLAAISRSPLSFSRRISPSIAPLLVVYIFYSTKWQPPLLYRPFGSIGSYHLSFSSNILGSFLSCHILTETASGNSQSFCITTVPTVLWDKHTNQFSFSSQPTSCSLSFSRICWCKVSWYVISVKGQFILRQQR